MMENLLLSLSVVFRCFLRVNNAYVFLCLWQTKELSSRVASVDSQLERTSRERDDAQDLVAWQRSLIQRQLDQVRKR